MNMIYYKVFELDETVIADCYCHQILHLSKKIERKQSFRKIAL